MLIIIVCVEDFIIVSKCPLVIRQQTIPPTPTSPPSLPMKLWEAKKIVQENKLSHYDLLQQKYNNLEQKNHFFYFEEYI